MGYTAGVEDLAPAENSRIRSLQEDTRLLGYVRSLGRRSPIGYILTWNTLP